MATASPGCHGDFATMPPQCFQECMRGAMSIDDDCMVFGSKLMVFCLKDHSLYSCMFYVIYYML